MLRFLHVVVASQFSSHALERLLEMQTSSAALFSIKPFSNEWPSVGQSTHSTVSLPVTCSVPTSLNGDDFYEPDSFGMLTSSGRVEHNRFRTTRRLILEMLSLRECPVIHLLPVPSPQTLKSQGNWHACTWTRKPTAGRASQRNFRSAAMSDVFRLPFRWIE